MKINLKNKTYVISAAADGIGFAIAKRLSAQVEKYIFLILTKKKLMK